jgi:hypothetical protein
LLCVRALKTVDLPTFGSPTIPIESAMDVQRYSHDDAYLSDVVAGTPLLRATFGCSTVVSWKRQMWLKASRRSANGRRGIE